MEFSRTIGQNPLFKLARCEIYDTLEYSIAYLYIISYTHIIILAYLCKHDINMQPYIFLQELFEKHECMPLCKIQKDASMQ